MRSIKDHFIPFWVRSLLFKMANLKNFEKSHGNYFSHLCHGSWNLRRNARHLEWSELRPF